MTKLVVAKISFYFFIIGLIFLVGLGTYLMIVGEFTGMTAIRGIAGIGLCAYAIKSFRKTIQEQEYYKNNQ